MRADGIGAPEALTDGETGGYPQATTRDGKSLVYRRDSGGRSDLFLLPLEGGGRAQALLADPSFDEINADISPDGQWIAYESNESGRQEVYVRPFPAVQGGRWQISAGGGSRPVWSPAGGELMFLTADERLASVAVRGAAGHAAAFTFGPRNRCSTVRFMRSAVPVARSTCREMVSGCWSSGRRPPTLPATLPLSSSPIGTKRYGQEYPSADDSDTAVPARFGLLGFVGKGPGEERRVDAPGRELRRRAGSGRFSVSCACYRAPRARHAFPHRWHGRFRSRRPTW